MNALNVLFTALAFTVVAVSLRLQSDELREQRREMRMQSSALEEQASTQLVRIVESRLDALVDVVDDSSMHVLAELEGVGAKEYVLLACDRFWRAREVFLLSEGWLYQGMNGGLVEYASNFGGVADRFLKAQLLEGDSVYDCYKAIVSPDLSYELSLADWAQCAVVAMGLGMVAGGYPHGSQAECILKKVEEGYRAVPDLLSRLEGESFLGLRSSERFMGILDVFGVVAFGGMMGERVQAHLRRVSGAIEESGRLLDGLDGGAHGQAARAHWVSRIRKAVPMSVLRLVATADVYGVDVSGFAARSKGSPFFDVDDRRGRILRGDVAWILGGRSLFSMECAMEPEVTESYVGVGVLGHAPLGVQLADVLRVIDCGVEGDYWR